MTRVYQTHTEGDGFLAIGATAEVVLTAENIADALYQEGQLVEFIRDLLQVSDPEVTTDVLNMVSDMIKVGVVPL